MAAESFHKETLENGLTIVVERHPQVMGVSVGVWVKVGASHENPQQNGICHFIEHMLFKGTKTRSPLEIVSELESIGGDLNAFTDHEYTCYHATVLKQDVNCALEILSDLVIHPTFPRGEIEKERKILLQEMAMVEENPEDWVASLYFQTIWKGEPLGLPVLGTKKSVKSLSRRHLNKFFQDNYRPEHMVISVAGDIDPKTVISEAEKRFRFSTTQKALPLESVESKYHARKRSFVFNTEQLHLIVGFPCGGLHDPERFAALVLSYYLGGGMSSDLFQEIREKAALAYNIDCDATGFAHSGVFSIYVATSYRNLKRCLRIIGRELKKLKEQTISESKLQKVKNQIIGALLLSADQMEVRQESLGRHQVVYGRHIPIDEIVDKIQAVTPQAIQQYAQGAFVESKESAVTLGRVRFKSKQLSCFNLSSP